MCNLYKVDQVKLSIYNNFFNVNIFISPTVCDMYNIITAVYKKCKILIFYNM